MTWAHVHVHAHALPEELVNPLFLRVGERAAGNFTVNKDADKSNQSFNERRLRGGCVWVRDVFSLGFSASGMKTHRKSELAINSVMC